MQSQDCIETLWTPYISNLKSSENQSHQLSTQTHRHTQLYSFTSFHPYKTNYRSIRKNNYSGKFIEKSLVGALLKQMVNVGAKPKSVASFLSCFFFLFLDHSFYVRLTDNFMEISVRSKNVHSSFFCFAVYDKSSLLKYWPEQNWKWIQTFTKADLQPILSHVELILFSESFNWFPWFFNFQNRHKF